MWNELRSGLTAALTSCGLDAGPALERLELAIPRERAHGDWSTNLAIASARRRVRPSSRNGSTHQVLSR